MKTRRTIPANGLDLSQDQAKCVNWTAGLPRCFVQTLARARGGPLFAGTAAFTQVDLLAVLIMLAVVFVVLLPALATPWLNPKSFQCLNNHRQMCNAWRVYADDNRDRIVYASTGTEALRGQPSIPMDTINPNNPNNFAWTGAHMDFSADNLADWDTNFDMVLRPLWPYTASNASIYKCPTDQSYVVFNGKAYPRIQSISMNLYLGGFTGTDGGWAFADAFQIFFKTTDLTAPGPAKTFVFMDGRPDGLNWGNFMTDMTGYSPSNPASFSIADWPGYYHDGGAGLSFADGHTEIHRWTDPRTTPVNISLDSETASPNNPDVAWLQNHSTRPK
jgi:prepilin-type processing-associated H-X9-DG protein